MPEDSKDSQQKGQQPSDAPAPAPQPEQAQPEAPAAQLLEPPRLNGKKYRLKASETNTLRIFQQNQQSSFAAMLSMIAVESFGYNVTQNTQFQLTADYTEIEIAELPPADVPQTQGQPEQPGSGAVTA
jgi:hypothetical protein